VSSWGSPGARDLDARPAVSTRAAGLAISVRGPSSSRVCSAATATASARRATSIVPDGREHGHDDDDHERADVRP
jgi:hypothetical protein